MYGCLVFQKSDGKTNTVFDIGHFKLLAKYLTCLGINPYQNKKISNSIVTAILISSITIFGPTSMQLSDTIHDKNFDGIIEDLPLMITGFVAIMKVLNIRSNKTRFKRLFDSVKKQWDLLETKNDLCMLENLTEQGGKLAGLYRHIVVPLNETRQRHHIFKVNYVVLDEYKYFYAAYIHMSASASFVVFMIIAVDSLYITIIYHAIGLFGVCGYQVEQATEKALLEKNGAGEHDNVYEEFKHCVMMHYEALLFYDTLERCCRNLYLIQMGLNMLIISLTAVEIVMFLDRPEELIRAVVFLAAQKFHLYVISLPGQTLLDHSLELGNKIYSSKWYYMPVNVQKVIYMMQIRCNKPCILTAGGLYEMKIESFGATVKTCISYMTMFLSLRE